MADQDRRNALSAAWGVLTVVTAGGAIAIWAGPASSPSSGFPIWPAYAFGAVALMALYMTFATLLGLPPTRARSEIPSAQAVPSLSQADGPLPAASPAVNPDEFKPYHEESGEFPDTKALTFGFDHLTDHPGAYMALNPRRCTVVTPFEVTVSATRSNRYFQYPQEFENAPAVRPGLYRFRLEGQLSNGEWAFITKGEHDVKAPPPLIVTIVDGRFENWKHTALIAALRVKVTNTTGQMIRLSSVGFSYDTEGKPPLRATLDEDENLELDGELFTRRERQHYGIALNGYATVPADESITGWVVNAVTRLDGGTPSCTIAVKDQLGNEYRVTRPKEQAKTYG
jgi:hypothetical protein